jgi:error-prone DNA polymerase
MGDFIRRMHITMEQLLLLVRLDAFRFTGQSKKVLLWEAHMLLGKTEVKNSTAELFREPPRNYQLPELMESKIENAYDEMQLLGFPVSCTRFDLLQTVQRLPARADNLLQYVGQTIRIMGDFVAHKPVRTSNGKEMAFGTFVDEDGNFFDTTHFPPELMQYPFEGSGVYLILGRVVEEFGFPSIEVVRQARLAYRKNPVAGDK